MFTGKIVNNPVNSNIILTVSLFVLMDYVFYFKEDYKNTFKLTLRINTVYLAQQVSLN